MSRKMKEWWEEKRIEETKSYGNKRRSGRRKKGTEEQWEREREMQGNERERESKRAPFSLQLISQWQCNFTCYFKCIVDCFNCSLFSFPHFSFSYLFLSVHFLLSISLSLSLFFFPVLSYPSYFPLVNHRSHFFSLSSSFCRLCTLTFFSFPLLKQLFIFSSSHEY